MSKILVIDEDGFARTGLMVQLGERGYSVLSAADAVTGLALADAPLSAAIVEMQVPAEPQAGTRRRRVSAFELIQRLRLLQPHLAILILTHDDSGLDGFLELVRAGVRGIAYLLKGISVDTLTQTLARIQLGQTEIDPDVAPCSQDLGRALLTDLTDEERPWVERALDGNAQLTPQETRAVQLMAASHNLAGIARRLAIVRADTLVGRVYVKLGLDDMPRQAPHLRQNAILIKASQIERLRARHNTPARPALRG